MDTLAVQESPQYHPEQAEGKTTKIRRSRLFCGVVILGYATVMTPQVVLRPSPDVSFPFFINVTNTSSGQGNTAVERPLYQKVEHQVALLTLSSPKSLHMFGRPSIAWNLAVFYLPPFPRPVTQKN